MALICRLSLSKKNCDQFFLSLPHVLEKHFILCILFNIWKQTVQLSWQSKVLQLLLSWKLFSAVIRIISQCMINNSELNDFVTFVPRMKMYSSSLSDCKVFVSLLHCCLFCAEGTDQFPSPLFPAHPEAQTCFESNWVNGGECLPMTTGREKVHQALWQPFTSTLH